MINPLMQIKELTQQETAEIAKEGLINHFNFNPDDYIPMDLEKMRDMLRVYLITKGGK